MPVPDVETVQGTVAADELGVTLVHEHMRARDDAVAAEWPGAYDEQAELEKALAEVRRAQAHGVQTIVDPTAMFLGRDVRFMKRVADATGVRIVACTGIYSYGYLPQFFVNRDVDAMAALFVSDIEDGIQGTPIRAAFLKCAADQEGVTDNIEKIHRAAARASLQTGAPIMAHSAPPTANAPRQIDIFLEEGVAPERIQIAHAGDTDDVDFLQSLIERGVYVGLDRYGLELFLPIDKRNATAAELLRRGYAERIMLSQDASPTLDWYPPESGPQFEESGAIRNWTMSLVFEEVIPTLRELGVMDDAVFQTVFVENPRRWLTV
jgi:phosphotriesterase-related protein